MFKGTLRTAQ